MKLQPKNTVSLLMWYPPLRKVNWILRFSEKEKTFKNGKRPLDVTQRSHTIFTSGKGSLWEKLHFMGEITTVWKSQVASKFITNVRGLPPLGVSGETLIVKLWFSHTGRYNALKLPSSPLQQYLPKLYHSFAHLPVMM